MMLFSKASYSPFSVPITNYIKLFQLFLLFTRCQSSGCLQLFKTKNVDIKFSAHDAFLE